MKQKVSLFAILFFEQKKKGKGEPEAIRSWQKNTLKFNKHRPMKRGPSQKENALSQPSLFRGYVNFI